MMALLWAALLVMPQDPRIDATLSATTVRVGDAFVYQIVIASDDAAPTRVGSPDLPAAFEVLRTQDFTETQLTFPGGRTRRFRREIVLVAHAPGSYLIPAAQIEIGGRHYTTPELHLVVTGGAAARGGDVPGRARLRIDFVPDTVFVGQQALLRAEALIPEGRRPRRGRAPTFEPPQPTGFWTQDLPQSRQSSLRLVGGDVFEVHAFSRAYFPLSPGPRVLPPASVVYEARQDWFSGTRLERLTADTLRLEVLPLPVQDRPAAFAGAVGKFSLETHLEPARVHTGEAATLVVEITGEGNVKGLPPPVLPELVGAEALPAGDDAQSWVSDGIIHGTRRFRWMIVPEAGTREVRLDGIEFAYFDPYDRQYARLLGEELRLHVLPGLVASAADPPVPFELRRRPAPERLSWVRSPLFVTLNVLPLLGLIGVFVIRRRSRRRRARAKRRRGDVLRAWRVRSGSSGLTPDGLRRAFVRSVAEAAELRVTMVGDDAALAARLAERGVGDAAIERLRAALARLDEVRFAGGEWNDAGRAELVRALDHALHEVLADLRAARRGAAASPGRAGVWSLALLAAALVPASLPAASSSDFERGVEAFERADYTASAAFFAAHVAQAPKDAAAWYNLGIVNMASGDTGAAVGAWLRVIAVHPRDREARARLIAAGAENALRAASPPLRLAGSEALLVASLLWLATLGGVGLSAAGQRRQGVMIALAAAALLLVHATALGAGAVQRQRRAIAVAEPTLLRAAPALRAEELDRMSTGHVFRVIEQRDAWLRVSSGRLEGWVDRRDVVRP